MKPTPSLIAFFSSRLCVITVAVLGSAGTAGAQTWTNTTTGTSNWSTGTNWDTTPVAPVSGTTTTVKFFATPGTVIPAASAVVANQDIATPMVLNSLTVNGIGPGTGAGPVLTISGGAIQFAGTSPALNINAGYGTSGYTVNLNSNLDFSADTAINFSNAGAVINVGGAVTFSGAGKVTFTGNLNNRPLSLLGVGTFTGDMVLNGVSSVLQLNKNHNILGPNTATTQSVTVASGSGVNLAYGNAAYTQPQNFVVSGNGNTATGSAAVNATGIGFGNGIIGGLALAADSTVRTVLQNANEARNVTISRGIVGTGKLVKTGNAYLVPNVASPATVTWGGTVFSAYTGNVEIKEGAIQTPAVSNALGSNPTPFTQRVTVSAGASMIIGAGTNAWTQPQNMILNGNGTGYLANNGGFGALESFGAGFGSNTVRRIVVATDSTVAVKRDGSSFGLGRGLGTQVGLSGAGNLTVGTPYGSATGPLYLGQAASAFEEFAAFSGMVYINNGILNIGDTDALGTSPNGQITLSGLGAVSSSLSGGLNQAFLSRIANLSTTSGAVCLGSTSANNLDFTTAPSLRLGAINNFTYSGILTPAASVYRLGGGGGTLTVSSQLTGSASVVISGPVVLSNATNNFNGGVTIASNNTGLGQTGSLGFTGGTGNLNGNAISFGGAGGDLSYTGAAAGSSDNLGVLFFSTGHGNVISTKGAAGNTFLTFSSMTARSAGATGNFTVTGGTNGTDNKITITGLASGFVDKGIFFGGANYAYNDATGFLRAPVYGTDAGFVTSAATTSLSSATHQQITGALSTQNSATFTTLKVAGANNVTLAASQTLTVDGLLKTGGNASTFSGGTGVQASLNSEMVVRTDAAGDALTFSIPILANGTNSLTKSGAGSVTLNAVNTYTGTTTVVGGTLTVGSTGDLEDASPVIVNGGTYASNTSSDTVGLVTLKNGVIGGTGIHQGSSYIVENGMVTGRLGGSGSLTKTTSGQVILAGTNFYFGGTTISGGTLTVSGSGSLDDSSPVTIENGATYELVGPDTVGDVTLTNGTIRGPGALNAASYSLKNGTVSAPLAGTGTITKSTADTVTLAGSNNTLVGDIVVNAGTLALDAKAKLNFAINGLTSNSISGTGTVLLDGTFGIDLSLADTTPGNTWTLVNAATLTETFGPNFNIPGFTEVANVWTKVDGFNKWTFTEATGVLKLSSLAGYTGWIGGFGLPVADQDPSDDPDYDGISNLMEYVLYNGQPATPSTAILPTADASGANLIFTFYRRNESLTDTTQTFQYGTDLNGWTDVLIPGGAGVTVTPDTPSSGIDKVEISVVKSPNTKLFGRLKVTQP